MRDSLAWFGGITAVYTLMTLGFAWFGFEYDQPGMVETAGSIHALGWTLSYIILGIFLSIDLVYWIIKK